MFFQKANVIGSKFVAIFQTAALYPFTLKTTSAS